VDGENVVAESEKLAGLVFSNTPMPLKPGVVSSGVEKTMSGRPSLFMSAISGVCIAPFFVISRETLVEETQPTQARELTCVGRQRA